MEISASLTDTCNLACEYRYAPLNSQADMSVETLETVVDFAVSSTPEGDTLEFGFFGGEPLLRPDLIQFGARMARDQCQSLGIPLQLRVTTNGTLLDDDVIDLLKRYRIDLCVSIDGPPHIHDRIRRFHDGAGSSGVVVENLVNALENLDFVQVNSVFGPETLEALPQTVAYLAALGVRLIHLNLDIGADWPSESFSRMRRAYDEVAEMVLAHYRADMPLVVNLIDSKIVLFLKGGYSPNDRCGMGLSKIGFSTNGSMFPCERLIGNGRNGHCFGDIRTGPDPVRLAAIQNKTGNRNPECSTCPVERFCMNWCGCTNYHMTGHTDLIAPALCASEKASMAAARIAMTDLADTTGFIEHFMARLHEDYDPQKGNRA